MQHVHRACGLANDLTSESPCCMEQTAEYIQRIRVEYIRSDLNENDKKRILNTSSYISSSMIYCVLYCEIYAGQIRRQTISINDDDVAK